MGNTVRPQRLRIPFIQANVEEVQVKQIRLPNASLCPVDELGIPFAMLWSDPVTELIRQVLQLRQTVDNVIANILGMRVQIGLLLLRVSEGCNVFIHRRLFDPPASGQRKDFLDIIFAQSPN